jgi:hypothetical protein
MPGSFVSCTGFEPSAFITKISELPVRRERNAIRLPSGENSGSSSATRSLKVSCLTPPPFQRIT